MTFYTCRHVLEEDGPIRMVTHDDDGPVDDPESWTATCGECGDEEASDTGRLLDGPCFWALGLPPQARTLGVGRALVRYDPGHAWMERPSGDDSDIQQAPLAAA